MTTQSQPIAADIQVFVSYAHKDDNLRSELDKHLTLLKRKGIVDVWYDRKILPGTDFGAEIDSRLSGSQLVLFLVSPDFLASGYCYEKEMARAMQMHQAGSARVIPVILRPVDWKDAPFGKLLALPKDGKPVTKWANRDSALLDVTEGIKSAINGLAKEWEKSRAVEPIGMPVLRRFGGQVIHIGGVGSRVVTKIAYMLDEHGIYQRMITLRIISTGQPISCGSIVRMDFGSFLRAAQRETMSSLWWRGMKIQRTEFCSSTNYKTQ